MILHLKRRIGPGLLTAFGIGVMEDAAMTERTMDVFLFVFVLALAALIGLNHSAPWPWPGGC